MTKAEPVEFETLLFVAKLSSGKNSSHVVCLSLMYWATIVLMVRLTLRCIGSRILDKEWKSDPTLVLEFCYQ